MIQQAIDFREESDALYQLLEPIASEDFQKKTQFKEWTINDVLGHLHMWNWAADISLNDSAAFEKFLTSLIEAMTTGSSLQDFEGNWRKGIQGKELLQEWRKLYLNTSKLFEAADPKLRVKWFGPDMSVRSSITARLMETWAHGQEVYDMMGVERVNKDLIKNIAVLGVNTFGWTYSNRSMDVPEDKPYVKLTAPSGEIWEWNNPSDDNMVEGSAAEFCQVVTHVRSIGDTSLNVIGETATQWMSIAQCFAGPAVDQPTPGTRYTQ